MVKMTLSSSDDPVAFMRSAVSDLQNAATYIGVPDKTTQRKRNMIGPQQSAYITNAGLLYIHSNGSQLRKIPARPVIEPTIQANRLYIESQLHLIASDRLDGKTKEARQRLKMLGTFAANASKAWFTNPLNNWPQNAPSTIRKKLSRLGKQKSRKARINYRNAMQIVGFYEHQRMLKGRAIKYGELQSLDNINTPLIDIGELRRSITHVEKL